MSSGLPSELLRALLPLSEPPDVRGWNHDEMADLLGDTARQPAAVLVGLREGVQPQLVLTVRNDRESEEEIGLDRRLVTPLGYLDRFETISGYSVTPVVASIAAEAQLYPAPGEVAEVFEVPLAFFLAPENLRRYTMDFRGKRREMVEFVHGDHRIWGATAAMLLNLLRRMGRA